MCCVNKRAYTMYGKDSGKLHDAAALYTCAQNCQSAANAESGSS